MAHGEDAKTKALRLTAAGMSARDAEGRLRQEGHEVSYRSIARWEAARVAALNAQPRPAPAGKATAPKAGKAPAASPRAPAPAALPSVDQLAEETEELLDAADRAHARLDLLHGKLVTRIDDELLLTVPDLKTLAPVTKLALEVAVVLAKTRPPVAVRPEDDPTNLDAAARLLVALDKLVVDARRKVGLNMPEGSP